MIDGLIRNYIHQETAKKLFDLVEKRFEMKKGLQNLLVKKAEEHIGESLSDYYKIDITKKKYPQGSPQQNAYEALILAGIKSYENELIKLSEEIRTEYDLLQKRIEQIDNELKEIFV